jgi:hypothetical protein
VLFVLLALQVPHNKCAKTSQMNRVKIGIRSCLALSRGNASPADRRLVDFDEWVYQGAGEFRSLPDIACAWRVGTGCDRVGDDSVCLNDSAERCHRGVDDDGRCVDLDLRSG